LSERLAAITINNARLPVYSNITARPVTDGGKIKELLVRQVTGSVLWEDSVKNMIDEGVSKFIEVGPGKVLAGLIKKISANVEVISYEEVN